MFMMTETAGEYLTAVLDNANASEETAIRFVLEGNTLTPRLDNARPGDATFDYEGRRVLVLDGQVSQALAESTLDVQTTEEGPKLILLQ
jgi:hypothetical protein